MTWMTSRYIMVLAMIVIVLMLMSLGGCGVIRDLPKYW